jgi:hypothetical protein
MWAQVVRSIGKVGEDKWLAPLCTTKLSITRIQTFAAGAITIDVLNYSRYKHRTKSHFCLTSDS